MVNSGLSGWVIFDADNTLWNLERLYDEARDELCDYLERLGLNKDDVVKYQRSRDKALHATYGYSACRFARSFEDTASSLLAGKCTDERTIHVRNIALKVFERDPECSEGLEDLFRIIKKRGYKIALITAGEKWVQERRISRFHLTGKIDEIRIVERKTEDVFRSFAAEVGACVDSSWVVGDSVKSDVEPALAAGFSAVLYSNHNWHEVEAGDVESLDEGNGKFRKIQNLDELRDILMPIKQEDGGYGLRHMFVAMLFALAVGQLAVVSYEIISEYFQCEDCDSYSIYPSLFHIVLALAVITTSWVDWSKTFHLFKIPPLEKVFSISYLVLIIDVVILSLYFALVQSVDRQGEVSANPEIYILTVIFGLYVVWDIVTACSMGAFRRMHVYVLPSLLIALCLGGVVFVRGKLDWWVADLLLLSAVFLFRFVKRIQIDLCGDRRETP